LTNGKRTFIERFSLLEGTKDQDFSRGHLIAPGSNDFYRSADMPLDLNRPMATRDDLAQNLRATADRKGTLQLESLEEGVDLEGTITVKITLRSPYGRRTYWVDLEHGAIPLRIEDDLKEGADITWIQDDLRQVDGGAWLPFRRILVFNGITRQTVLSQADFANRPDPSSFVFELDPPASVIDPASGRSYLNQKRIDLNHLPAAGSRDTVPIPAGSSGFGSMQLPGERDARPPYFTYLAATIAALVIAVMAWKGYRSRARQGGMTS
jgi:hypothetical protein